MGVLFYMLIGLGEVRALPLGIEGRPLSARISCKITFMPSRPAFFGPHTRLDQQYIGTYISDAASYHVKSVQTSYAALPAEEMMPTKENKEV